MSIVENDTVQLLALAVAGIGGLNWGLVEFLDFNVITELVSQGTTEYQVIVGVLAVAGILVLLQATEEVGN